MPGRPKAPKKKTAKKTKKAATTTRARPKAVAKKKTTTTKRKPKPAPAPAPSERALATSAQLPVERPLTDDERDAMAKVADTARQLIGAVGGPDAVVHRIAAFVDEVRTGQRRQPESQDVRLGLGALWGEQVRAQVGWIWVHLTYPDGFASYAVVPDDRAFACFPLNRMQDLMAAGPRTNTCVAVWSAIVSGALPTRRPNAYLVIG